MIYWNGGRRFGFLSAGALFEGVYFDYRRTKFVTPISWLGGRMFIVKIAAVMKSSIVIYEKLPFCVKGHLFSPKIVERIPFVSEFAEVFPEKFAIRTKNIDLLRELISQGKKVTWFEPDLYTQAHYLGILNFEHVFLEPNIDTHIIYPSGEVVERDEALSKGIFDNWQIKYAKRVGVNFKDIHARIDWRFLGKKIWRRKKLTITRNYIMPEIAANIYNVFSLTYLIWQQSKLNAKTVRKKTAPKEF